MLRRSAITQVTQKKGRYMRGYEPPKLDGHQVLYKGRRFWVFKVDADHPFEDFERDCSVIVYDKLYAEPVAFCDTNLNGYVSCWGLLHAVDVYGINPRALAQEVAQILKNLKHYC